MKITGIIMAGGGARRLGRNKALVEIGGRPVLERIMDVLGPVCDELILSANDPAPYEKYGLKVIPDEYEGVGVIGGIHASLKASKNDRCLVVACDMPFLNPGILALMAGYPGDWDALVPRWEAGYEPLHAIYSKACIGPIEKLIGKGGRRIYDFYSEISVQLIGDDEIRAIDPKGRSFFNINSAEDLVRARRIAEEMGQGA